ncbi:MAG: hypothetical protein AAF399_07110 [Bacteroidota bacterium]
MKHLALLFLCIVVWPSLTRGQSSSPSSKVQHRLGLNATHLLSQFLSGSDSVLHASPYLLTYKLSRGNWGLRVGLGGEMRSEILQEAGFADSETSEELGIDGRIGLEYHPRLARRWIGTIGLDGLLFAHADRQISDTGFDKITLSTYSTGWGVGPVMGMEFQLNDRLALYSEGALYYTQASIENNRIFTNFPELNDLKNVGTFRQIRWTLPATIYLIVRF